MLCVHKTEIVPNNIVWWPKNLTLLYLSLKEIFSTKSKIVQNLSKNNDSEPNEKFEY